MLWEKLINGKYQKWINVCMQIHFIFEITEDTLKIIVSYKFDWDKNIKLKTKFEVKMDEWNKHTCIYCRKKRAWRPVYHNGKNTGYICDSCDYEL